MATKTVPINGEVLRWALDDAGMDVGQVAQRIAAAPEDMAAWISGERKPNTTTVNKLANVLRRPPSFFLRPRPPQEKRDVVNLRVAYGNARSRPLTPEERVEVRKALRRQKIASWAAAQSQVTSDALPLLGATPEATAISVQKWLKWDIRDQVTAKNKSDVTRLLRRRLESRGFLVFQYSLKDAIRGFSFLDARTPLIAFNSNGQVASARTYTILHELCHLLHGEGAVCGASDAEHERWCDRFAAAFLIPGDSLLEYLRSTLQTAYVNSTDIDSVEKISTHFKASYQCVALRLWNLKLAPYELFEFIRSGESRSEVDSGRARGGQPTPQVRLREYGTAYPRVLWEAYEESRLSDADIRKYLAVNGEQLRTLMGLVADSE